MAVITGLAAGAAARASAPPIAPIANPAGPGAMGSSVVTSATGETWLSWLEPVDAETWSMKCARFDAAHAAWGPTRIVAQGKGWFTNWADFPTLAVDGNRLTAVWFVENPGASGHHASYAARFATSGDGGVIWSEPQPITKESQSVEFVVLQPIANGRVLAAWLDGRDHAQGQALYSRVLDETGSDLLVDPLVCDCCQLTMTEAQGAVTLAYRGRTKDEVRDMRVAQFSGGKWSKPTELHADGWKIAACPVNGPQLAAHGPSLGAAWYTAAGENPRVFAAHAAGNGTFGRAVQINVGRAVGRVDSVMLPDGRLLLTWLEASNPGKAGGLFLRSLAPDGTLGNPVLIAPAATARSAGFARITLLAGGKSLLLTSTDSGEPSRIKTLLIALSGVDAGK